MGYEMFESEEASRDFIKNFKPGGWIGNKRDFRECADEMMFFGASDSYIERMRFVVIWNI